MARGTAAQMKMIKAKAAASAKRARDRYKAGEAQFATGVLVGGAAAGALDGYDFQLEIGDFEIGYGLPIGAVLVAGDGFGNPLAKGAGYGMLAAEISLFVSDLVADMTDDEGDADDLDTPDED